MASAEAEQTRNITIGPIGLEGVLGVPQVSTGIVLFAHGSGSGRLSPRNNFVAQAMRKGGLATLLFDLLTEAEAQDRGNVFDIPLLAERLLLATDWATQDRQTAALPIGYFGASPPAERHHDQEVGHPHLVAHPALRGTGRPQTSLFQAAR
jgi:putative phosphoribosyl transferase